MFSQHEVSEELRNDMFNKNIWNSSCPIKLEYLTLLKLSYYDFDLKLNNDGEILVHKAAANNVLKIFKALLENKFPLERIKLINEYNGDDEKSMEANNSSAFNFRKIMYTNEFSIHSYGLAIDINPKQNPYLITSKMDGKSSIPVYPVSGIEFVNRINIRPGMVENKLKDGSTVIDLFNKNGFKVWGGNWNSPVDWHHFQVTKEQAEIIANSNLEESINYFNSLCS